MSDRTKLGSIKIFFDGARWVAQQFERAPGVDPSSDPFGLPSWWRPLAGGKTPNELLKALKAVVPYPHEALRVLEQMMRRRGS